MDFRLLGARINSVVARVNAIKIIITIQLAGYLSLELH